jgi:hypothetical protein
MTPEETRAQRLQLLEDHIGHALQDGGFGVRPRWK